MRSPDLYLGDCLFWLAMLPDNSVDAVVTDPPYGLSFMGKKWDYDVPGEAIWRECLRVLKPGGHLLAFAGTRTQHRMAVRIEDAGFEIRDMIAWVYGSGFPKSLDVSKAIDKLDASEAQQARRYRFTEWVRSTGLTAKQIDEATSTNMGGHYTTAASQPAIMTLEHLDAVRHLIGEVPEWVERECEIRSVESENFKQREVVGQAIGTDTAKARLGMPGQDNQRRQYDITAPATDAARQWQGWGTALKPALEPITVARKPLIGTVAENVLAHGTGAINVDGCRVDASDGRPLIESKAEASLHAFGNGLNGSRCAGVTTQGRWPANLIHDGSDEVVGLFPGNAGASAPVRGNEQSTTGQNGILGHFNRVPGPFHADSGSAARFFYCAKASKRDRDEGCEGLAAKRTTFADGTRLRNNGDGTPRNQEPSNRNHHPTVKPTDLMRYLCRLVTPPGGTVLDPFMGSGSTGKAAALEGFHFIGMERDADYFTIAQARIDHARKAD